MIVICPIWLLVHVGRAQRNFGAKKFILQVKFAIFKLYVGSTMWGPHFEVQIIWN